MFKCKNVNQTSVWLSAMLIVCIGFVSCQSGNELQVEEETPVTQGKERQDIPLTKAEETMVEGNNAFGFNLLQVVSEKEEGNLFLSPLSATFALGMLNNGAAGITSEEIRNALGYAGIPTEEMNDYFLKMLTALKTIDPDVTLESANSIWIRNDFQALPSFVEANQTKYDAEVRHEDFSNPATLALINNWCAEKTHGKIDRILDKIPENAIMYLINGLYFKGIWSKPFEKEQTKNQTFANEDGSTPLVPMMRKELPLTYAQNELFGMVEVPYGNEAFSMIFLLPAEGVSLQSVIENLNASVWNDCLAGLSPRTVRLGIPRIELAYEIQLKDALKKLGMLSMFDAETVDLSGIHPTASLVVSGVKQKTALEINEEGSEASAVTIVEIVEMASPTTPPSPVSFILNRPFLLFIKEKSTGTILFEGVVRKL
jgi:serpin B